MRSSSKELIVFVILQLLLACSQTQSASQKTQITEEERAREARINEIPKLEGYRTSDSVLALDQSSLGQKASQGTDSALDFCVKLTNTTMVLGIIRPLRRLSTMVIGIILQAPLMGLLPKYMLMVF